MYDVEDEEQRHKTILWFILTIIFGFITLFVLVLNVKEGLLVHNGEQLTLPYSKNMISVSFLAEDNQIYYVDFSGLPIKTGKDSVNIYYYKGKEGNAKPQTATWFWVSAYVIFVPLLTLSINRIYVHLKKPVYIPDSKY